MFLISLFHNIHFYYIAEEGDISFDKGDVITNIDKKEDGWWEGTTKYGERGMFPSNFVKLCENTLK